MSSTESNKMAKRLAIAIFGPAVIAGGYILYSELSRQNEASAEAERISATAQQIKQSLETFKEEIPRYLITADAEGVISVEPRPDQTTDVISVTTRNQNQCESFSRELTRSSLNYTTVIVANKRYPAFEWLSINPAAPCLLAFQNSPQSVTVQIEIP